MHFSVVPDGHPGSALVRRRGDDGSAVYSGTAFAVDSSRYLHGDLDLDFTRFC